MNSNWTLMNYRELKKQIKNAVSELGTVLELKGVVVDTSKLPLIGNKKGDVYIVSEDNTEYVWTSDNASGLVTDYEELGPVISGSFLPPVTETDAGKVATVNNSGAWGASLNQVEILADYDPATGIMTQRQGADVPTADELYTAFACNGTVRMRVFVNDHQVTAVYLYPFGDELGSILFGTVLRNRNEYYDESINVSFYVNDDVVMFDVDRSLAPKGRFIVTLTPTAQDYSGTMDKTVAEINAAYEAGQEIVFSLDSEIDGFNVTLTSVANETVYIGDYKGFHATFIFESRDVMIRAITNATFDGTDNTYSTSIFELTPAT